jgi:hypothetical protein
MNGRVYDPTLGRFVSPDLLIPNPENTQSYNRYSYVYNNPLSFTDPSGYSPKYNCEETVGCSTVFLSENGYKDLFMSENKLSGKVSDYDFTISSVDGLFSESLATGNGIFSADIAGVARGFAARRASKVDISIGMSFQSSESGRNVSGSSVTMTEWLTGTPYITAQRRSNGPGCGPASCNVPQGSGSYAYASYGDQWLYQNSLDGARNQKLASTALALVALRYGGPVIHRMIKYGTASNDRIEQATRILNRAIKRLNKDALGEAAEEFGSFSTNGLKAPRYDKDPLPIPDHVVTTPIK